MLLLDGICGRVSGRVGGSGGAHGHECFKYFIVRGVNGAGGSFKSGLVVKLNFARIV